MLMITPGAIHPYKSDGQSFGIMHRAAFTIIATKVSAASIIADIGAVCFPVVAAIFSTFGSI